jgi:hydrogenase expression/formation protein HypD
MVYSPLDALEVARRTPEREVVFFAVGFETTAPANAMAVYRARAESVQNFSMLASHVRVPPALRALLGSPDNRIEGFLAAGHVCTVMGTAEYAPIVDEFRVPIVVTGFEPIDVLDGVLRCVRQLEAGRATLENAYARSVRRDGNQSAQALMRAVFTVVPRRWRGLGEIAESGLGLNDDYADFDAERRFGIVAADAEHAGECVSGLVLRGVRKPTDCPAFGTRCTPEHPLGVTMVSTEGACAAYYRYRHTRRVEATP